MADTSNLSNFLEDVADAIRTKKETTEKIPAANFDTEILSITTGLDTSDATATVNDILAPKTAYVDGEKITGNIQAAYTSEYIRTKTISKTNVFDFNDIIAVCGEPDTREIKVYKVNNETLTNELPITFDSINIAPNYQLYSACISKLPVDGTIYNICLYVYDPDSSYSVDQMLYIIRFDTSTHDIIAGTSDLSRVIYSNVELGAGRFHNQYGSVTSHPTNPNCFVCGVGGNINTMYGRIYCNLIKFVNEVPTITEFQLLCGYVGLEDNTFIYFDIVPVNLIDTYIFIKQTSTDGGHYCCLLKFDEITNTITETVFTEKAYGAGILNKDYYIRDNNQIISFATGETVGTFPITLSWQQLIKSAGEDKFLLFDINAHLVSLYEYNVGDSEVILKESYTYNDNWNVKLNVGYMLITDIGTAINYYDRGSHIISVMETSDTAIKSLTIKNKTYIDVSDSTASAADILLGETAYGGNEQIIGTMPNNGELNYGISTSEQTIPAGYTSGGTIAASPLTEAEYNECLEVTQEILGQSVSL